MDAKALAFPNSDLPPVEFVGKTPAKALIGQNRGDLETVSDPVSGQNEEWAQGSSSEPPHTECRRQAQYVDAVRTSPGKRLSLKCTPFAYESAADRSIYARPASFR